MNFGANPIQLVLLDSVFLENRKTMALGSCPPKLPHFFQKCSFFPLQCGFWVKVTGMREVREL